MSLWWYVALFYFQTTQNVTGIKKCDKILLQTKSGFTKLALNIKSPFNLPFLMGSEFL